VAPASCPSSAARTVSGDIRCGAVTGCEMDGRPHVDREFDLRIRLDGDPTGILAFHDLVHQAGGLATRLVPVRTVADETTPFRVASSASCRPCIENMTSGRTRRAPARSLFMAENARSNSLGLPICRT